MQFIAIENNIFFNNELREFLRGEGIHIEYNSLNVSKNINMTKVFNRILKEVLRKQSHFNLNLK